MIIRLGYGRFLVLPIANEENQYFSHICFVAIQTYLKMYILEKFIKTKYHLLVF